MLLYNQKVYPIDASNNDAIGKQFTVYMSILPISTNFQEIFGGFFISISHMSVKQICYVIHYVIMQFKKMKTILMRWWHWEITITQDTALLLLLSYIFIIIMTMPFRAGRRFFCDKITIHVEAFKWLNIIKSYIH